MATFKKLPFFTTSWAVVRNGSKTVSTRRKKPLPFVKAKMVAFTQYKPPVDDRSLAEMCANQQVPTEETEKKINPWEELLKREAREMLEQNQLVAVLHDSGLSAEEKKKFGRKLRKQGLQLRWYPNMVMRQTLQESRYVNMTSLAVSTNLYVAGDEPKVKELIKITKTVPKVFLLGGKVENQLMSVPDMVKYSQLPSLHALQGQLVGLMTTPISRLRSLLQSNQQRLIMNLDQYAKQLAEEQTPSEQS
ncbi:large ribosomal subunit protein uL10m-like [Ptychodera flava]|uniref:large ribosomal subunit protein uL10m-like n=1 Tax=Ptychodera flava TaxID=63121 RepID=UPI00396A3F7A